MRKIALIAGLILATHSGFAASSYTMIPLVADTPNPFNAATPPTPCGSPATATCLQLDPHLIDGWGIAITASSPFWLSNAGTGLATVYSYSATATPNITVTATAVTVPSASGGAGPVTGQIASSPLGAAFAINGAPTAASFMFCTQDGTISARIASSPNTAIVTVNKAGAVYKGCAAINTSAGPRFYAANFSQGTVDVFDANWNPVATGGGFSDPNLPAGLSPFNVQAFPYTQATVAPGQFILVTYAMLGPDGVHDVAGRGNGQVDVFDFDGNLLGTISDPSMNSPWGLELAPEFWGDYSFMLLVGNFGDGRINAFNVLGDGSYAGTLSDSTGKPITIPGLWGIQFGNGRSGGDAKTLYWTAGPGGEMHGAFGSITAQ